MFASVKAPRKIALCAACAIALPSALLAWDVSGLYAKGLMSLNPHSQSFSPASSNGFERAEYFFRRDH